MEDLDKTRSPSHRTADSDKVFLACQKWIEAVTGKRFRYPGDFRKSLEDGVLLCELVNKVKPGSVPHITRLPTHHAHLDNINQFIAACKNGFGMKGGQIFEATDLEDPTHRRMSQGDTQHHQDDNRKIRNVAVTLYWLGRLSAQQQDYTGPKLDVTAFKDLMGGRDVFQSIVSKQVKISSVVVPPPRPQPTKVTDLLRTKKPPPKADSAAPSPAAPSTVKNNGTGAAPSRRMPTPPAATPPTPTPPTPTPPTPTPPTPTPPAATPPSAAAPPGQMSVVTSVQELTVPIQSTGTGSFGFQIMGGCETDMPATIEFIVPGSPADQVGLQRGDTLKSVNGELVQPLPHGELVGMIKEAGQKGSMVVGVQRVIVDKAFSSQGGGSLHSGLQEENEVAIPEDMGNPPSLASSQETNAKRVEKQEVEMKPQEDPAVKTITPLQIKVQAENSREGGRKPSRPTRVVIHQTVLEPAASDASPPKQGHTSPLEDDINNLEQVEAEMKMLMADLASPPGLSTAARSEKQQMETTITAKEKGQVQVTISKPGKSSPPHNSHQVMAAEWVTQCSPPPVLSAEPVGGGPRRLSQGTGADEEELDTDARIHILEAELEELRKQAGMMGDEDLFKTDAEPNWELEESGEETPPPARAAEQAYSSPPEQAHSSPPAASARSAQQESEERKKNKEEEKWNLFATIAESTKLLPAPAKEVTAVAKEDLATSSNAVGNLHYSPATNQALADREAFLKEQMQEQRKTLNMEWQRLEEERQLLERMRHEDQSPVETTKKVHSLRKWSWQDAVSQQQSGVEEVQKQHGTKEVEQGRDATTVGGIDDDSSWLALQEQIQEEERQQQEEIARFEEEQRRRAEEERQRVEEERKRVQLQWEEEHKRQEAAKRRMEKEAAWILELEARKEQEKQQRAKEELARRAVEEKKRAEKETAWIRELEARKMADHQLPAEESEFVAQPTGMLSRTPPSYSPPPMTEEQQRKAEVIRQFDEMIALEDAKLQKQGASGTSTLGGYNHFSQPLPSSPSGVRASSSSPHVNQSYSAVTSQSYQRSGSTTRDAGKSAAVADVHHTLPAQRTASWRDVWHSPQRSPAVKHSKSFQHPQHPAAVCSGCSCPLGKEPSMSVSNSGLTFHIRCFRCDVCHRPLASGQLSVSILLRGNRPHCRNCFSSSAGLMATEC